VTLRVGYGRKPLSRVTDPDGPRLGADMCILDALRLCSNSDYTVSGKRRPCNAGHLRMCARGNF
jgi:hypothetical protein